jgi:hypothetical protein
MVAVFVAWVLFHALVRENAWVSRLQLPLFATSVALLAALSGLRPPALRLVRPAVALAAAGALWHGYSVAVANPTRPPLSTPPWAAARDWSYYVNRPSMLARHEAALQVARRIGCRRIGLRLGEDSYDYPLTWRAMRQGMEVRHVFGSDPWPCVVVAEEGAPAGLPDAREWLPTAAPGVFVSARALPR